MSRLAEDLAILQRAADAAGLVIYPNANNASFPHAATSTVPIETLTALAVDLEARRITPREQRLIDYEAVWLLLAAQQLLLHRSDGDHGKADRFQRLAEYLRASVEVDLVKARKIVEAA